VDNEDRPLADEVLAYLVQHPQAQDTVEGIVEWWLLEQRIRTAVADAEAAVSDLVHQDFLIKIEGSDGRMFYGLNRSKMREIRRHLRIGAPVHRSKPQA
jgi:hypothetical protein